MNNDVIAGWLLIIVVVCGVYLVCVGVLVGWIIVFCMGSIAILGSYNSGYDE